MTEDWKWKVAFDNDHDDDDDEQLDWTGLRLGNGRGKLHTGFLEARLEQGTGTGIGIGIGIPFPDLEDLEDLEHANISPHFPFFGLCFSFWGFGPLPSSPFLFRNFSPSRAPLTLSYPFSASLSPSLLRLPIRLLTYPITNSSNRPAPPPTHNFTNSQPTSYRLQTTRHTFPQQTPFATSHCFIWDCIASHRILTYRIVSYSLIFYSIK